MQRGEPYHALGTSVPQSVRCIPKKGRAPCPWVMISCRLARGSGSFQSQFGYIDPCAVFRAMTSRFQRRGNDSYNP